MITMYNSISGILSGKTAASTSCQAFIDNHGVEWVLEVSRTCFHELPPTGQAVRLFCYFKASEDLHYLVGFLKEDERRLFLDLLKVEGIGPRQSIKILSGMNPDGIARLLEAGDVDGLEKIPGLGKKTAQKMVLALKGKLSLEDDAPSGRGSGREAKSLGEYEDIAIALVNMGYDRKSVTGVLEELIPQVAELPKAQKEQELLKLAIRALS